MNESNACKRLVLTVRKYPAKIIELVRKTAFSTPDRPFSMSPCNKKLPLQPCRANQRPLSADETQLISVESKYFDASERNIPETFNYRLSRGSRGSSFRVYYFKFQSAKPAESYPHLGSPGDVWVQVAPPVRKLFYKTVAGWKEWLSGKSVLDSARNLVSGSQTSS